MENGKEDCHMDQAQLCSRTAKNFQVLSLMGVSVVKGRILNKTGGFTRDIGKIIAW